MPLDQINLFGDAASVAVRDMPIDRGAEFSPCSRYRYTLTRRWIHGGTPKTILWIGANPSIADTTRDDPTIRREMHFSNAWGFGAMVKVNIYPVISPSMDVCNNWIGSLVANPAGSAAMLTNTRRILAETRKAHCVVAAWGAIITDLEWVEVLAAVVMKAADMPLYCLGTTESGAPKHPMARGTHRVPDDQRPILWQPTAAASVGEKRA